MDKPPALAKKVKGLPTEQREECKKFLTCKYIECPLISPHVHNALSWQELGGLGDVHLRLIRHGKNFRVEPYWTTSRIGIRGRDGSSAWLTWIGNMKAGVLLANYAATWLLIGAMQ